MTKYKVSERVPDYGEKIIYDGMFGTVRKVMGTVALVTENDDIISIQVSKEYELAERMTIIFFNRPPITGVRKIWFEYDYLKFLDAEGNLKMVDIDEVDEVVV